MKVQNIKILAVVLGISILGSAQSFAAEKKAAAKAAPTPACVQEKADFKKLYIELQKSLNYEGKDAYLDGKNNLQLKPHTGNVYEGKVFEEALFKEYQNSLRKVALMYQAAKFDDKAPADFKTNQSLVDFIKAIDSEDGSKYISSNNINTVIDGLQKASVAKYPADSKFRINDNDKYLLKKLLTHAQDRLCSIEKYQETGKRDRNFTAEELEKKKNAPLNQLILAIKDAKLTKDSDIKFEDIVDEKVAVNSAIAANINALHEWAKKNKSCIPVIKTPGFMNSIQAGIQQCNYRKFVDALSDDNVTNIESILHFINSNEKFLKGIQAKAETAMDEFKLQAYVDRTFANLGNKINCTEVANSTKSGKRLFVRNLPYLDDKNKFDTSKIACKVKVPASKKAAASEKILTEQECTAKIDLISDELGRGLEVRQKNQKEAPISFSIKDNPDCSDIALVVPQQEEPKVEPIKPEPPQKPAKPLDAAACKIQGDAQKPNPIFMTLSFEKDKCQSASEFCAAEGKRETPAISKVQNPEVKDKVDCIVEKKETDATLTLKTKEECAKEGKDLSEDKKSCIETEAMCKAKKAEGKVFKWEDNKCVESDAVNPQEKECLEKIKTDPSFEWKDNKCVNKKEACEAQSKDDKTFIWTDKNTCEEKKESDEEKTCRENNAKRSEEKGGINSDWQIKDGKCVDTKEKKSSFKIKDDEGDAPEVKVRPEQPFTAPARFVPIQIPTRQMYILPGMM